MGLTKNCKKRFNDHLRGSSGSGSANIPPEIRTELTMKILEETTYLDAHEAEAKWIQQLKPEYNKRMSMPSAERARLDAIRERERYGPVMTKEERALVRKSGPPMECECGKKWDYTVVGGHLKTHRKSNKHLAYLASLDTHVATEPAASATVSGPIALPLVSKLKSVNISQLGAAEVLAARAGSNLQGMPSTSQEWGGHPGLSLLMRSAALRTYAAKLAGACGRGRRTPPTLLH